MAETVEIILKGKFENGKVILDTTSKIDKNIKKIGDDAAKTKKNVNSLTDSLKKLAKIVGVALLTREFGKLVKGSLQAAGAMEQVDVALTTMLGSAEKAAELQKDLIEFAKKTPFQIEGIFDTTKRLLAYGVAQEDIIDTMSTLGNVAAGVSVPIERLALVFGQVRSTGRLLGQDLNQFTQAGVPLLAELAKTLGKTEAEVLKLKESGQISFDLVKQSLENMTAEGGRFFNLMEAQSKTFFGILSNMQDSFFQVKLVLGNALLPTATKVVNSMRLFFERLIVTIDRNKEAISEFAEDALKKVTFLINNGIKPLLKLIGNFVTGIKTLIKEPLIKWLGLATAAFVGLRLVLLAISANPFIILATAIITAIGWLVDNFDNFSNSTKIALLEVSKAFKTMQRNIFATIDALLAKLAKLSEVPGFGWTKDLSESFNDATNDLIDDVERIESAISELEKDRFKENIGFKVGTEVQGPNMPEPELEARTQQLSLIEEDPEKAEKKRLAALKEENTLLLAEQKAFLSGTIANQNEAETLMAANRDLTLQQQLLKEGQFAEQKKQLDQDLLDNKISLDQFEAGLAQINNAAKLETAEQQFEAEKILFMESQADLNETKLLMQEEQDVAELEQLQLKLDSQVVKQDLQNQKLIAAKVKKDKAEEVQMRKKGELELQFEKLMNNKRFQGAQTAAGELVALQNSKNSKLAAIGKAAAIFQITVDSAKGAMSAYSSLAPIPFVGPGLGAAAAAAVIAFGAEQIRTATSASFAVGTPNIPADQLANVHKGEMIIPASFSEAIRSGDLSLSGNNSDLGGSGEAAITNINLSFDGAQFVGDFNDDDISMIGERLGQLISESVIPAIPTNSAT